MPLRLRIVDTIAIFSGLPAIVAVGAIVVASFRLANQLGMRPMLQNQFAFLAFGISIVVASVWIVSWLSIRFLRLVFRSTGLMTHAEARFFPLRADKDRIDPWPDEWQMCANTTGDKNVAINSAEHSDKLEASSRSRLP